MEEIFANDGVREGCGNFFTATSFMILYQIIVTQIFLNLFIAIIIDTFLQQNDLVNLEPSQLAIIKFTELWS